MMAYTREQVIEMGMLLTKLVDTGALGPRAASTDNPLLPGAVLDLLWTLMFGKSKEECDVKGGLFVLGTWKDQPVMSWHLNKINITEIIYVVCDHADDLTSGMKEEPVMSHSVYVWHNCNSMNVGSELVVLLVACVFSKCNLSHTLPHSCHTVAP